eukprot:s33_g34.t1
MTPTTLTPTGTDSLRHEQRRQMRKPRRHAFERDKSCKTTGDGMTFMTCAAEGDDSRQLVQFCIFHSHCRGNWWRLASLYHVRLTALLPLPVFVCMHLRTPPLLPTLLRTPSLTFAAFRLSGKRSSVALHGWFLQPALWQERRPHWFRPLRAANFKTPSFSQHSTCWRFSFESLLGRSGLACAEAIRAVSRARARVTCKDGTRAERYAKRDPNDADSFAKTFRVTSSPKCSDSGAHQASC